MSFLPNILHLNKDGDLSRVAGGPLRHWLFGRRVVLSRAICSYDRIKAEPNLSSSNQLKQAYLRALEKSPFVSTGVFLKSDKESVSIWSWDSCFVAQSTQSSDILCIPESALNRNFDDGFFIAECIDGFEGIFCQGDNVVISRWWPAFPTQQEWLRFTLSAEPFGATFEERPEPAASAKSNPQRLPHNELVPRDLIKMLDLGRLAIIGFVLTLMITLYPAGRWFFLNTHSRLLEAEIAEQSESFDQQLETVRARTELTQSIANISRVTNERSLVFPLAEAVELIIASGGSISSVTFSDSEWEILFSASEEFSETELVRLMEENEQLRSASVVAERRDGFWITRFQNAPLNQVGIDE